MAYRALYMLRKRQGITLVPRAAVVVRDGIDGLSGYSQWPIFRTCYALDDGTIEGKEAELHKLHLQSLARCNKRVMSHIVDQTGVNLAMTAIGIGGCALSQLFFMADLPFLGMCGTFISGISAAMPVPELAILSVHALRSQRLSWLLPKAEIPDQNSALHLENVNINLEYFQTRCRGFWFTVQPIMSAISVGLGASNTIGGIGRGDFGRAAGEAALTYVNFKFAEDGFGQWDGQARRLAILDGRRAEIIEQFEKTK